MSGWTLRIDLAVNTTQTRPHYDTHCSLFTVGVFDHDASSRAGTRVKQAVIFLYISFPYHTLSLLSFASDIDTKSHPAMFLLRTILYCLIPTIIIASSESSTSLSSMLFPRPSFPPSELSHDIFRAWTYRPSSYTACFFVVVFSLFRYSLVPVSGVFSLGSLLLWPWSICNALETILAHT